MISIDSIKQQAATDSPILFFDCALANGATEHWSTHAISRGSIPYAARVLKHNLFQLHLSADDTTEGVSQLSVTLANADSTLSQISREFGFKGALLTVSFAFADLESQVITTESIVLFKGVAGDPDSVTEDSLRLTFTNKLALQRVPVPEVRIQRTCPWNFPATADQRTQALSGSSQGRPSRYARCGYSADLPGGLGTLNGSSPYTSCSGSRTDCQARGMFSNDASGRSTKHFGGFEFVPSTISVRTHGDKTSHLSPVLSNAAKYNDPAPIVYGIGWLKAPVIFSRNDGNLTHFEALIGMGPIEGVLKLVVNDVEIPKGVAGRDMTSTGWYSSVTTGTLSGAFNLDFSDSHGQPLGDPYGSLAVMSVVVPNAICSGATLPVVEILVQGIHVDSYGSTGGYLGSAFSDNPAWIILDILQRSGWQTSELDLTTFARSASYCQTLIHTTDINGNPLRTARYKCNLVLTKRQTAAAVIRGIRVASCLMLRYGLTGLLELLPEASLANQHPLLPAGSNSLSALNNGWPVYEFSDGSAAFSGIARDARGASSVHLSSRSISETSNRLSVEFQNESNEYQQDSLSIVDADDSDLIGYEISSQSTALGIANQSQATRVLLRQLDKSTKGNLYVQFTTSFRALKVRPGDLITLTYAKEGFVRAAFRVLTLSPSVNYQIVSVFAQIHDDDWYSDNPAVLLGAGRQPGNGSQTPRPLIGTVPHLSKDNQIEYFDFSVVEDIAVRADGTAIDTITVGFVNPTAPATATSQTPLVSLSPTYSAAGGALAGGETLYYAVSTVNVAGAEGLLSFTIPAEIAPGTNSNSVQLTGLSFPSNAASFHVYRGTTPQQLYRIASFQPIAKSFLDLGLPVQPIGPPDPNFQHANFYYRYELAGPFGVSTASANSINYSDLGATPQAYGGMVVRIVEGTGRGQERIIGSNDQSTLVLTTTWTTIPDQTSSFVITEPSWQFGAISTSSPARFQILYRAGAVLQIVGYGANAANLEGSVDLCPITRCALGGGKPETGTTVTPNYNLAAPGSGMLTLSQVGFSSLDNTSSISTGTLLLYSFNELGTSSTGLSQNIEAVSSSLVLTVAKQAYVGQILQVGRELMSVVSVDNTATQYQVVRGVLGSTTYQHGAGEAVFHLDEATTVVPFSTGFFENRASTNFIHSFAMADVRICASQFFVTNAFGDSQAGQQCYLSSISAGLRTLSGGQFSLQVAGVLGTQTSAAPAMLVEASHAIRDVHASVAQAPVGCSIGVDVVQSGSVLCSLAIAAGTTNAVPMDGGALPTLLQGSALTLNTTVNVMSAATVGFTPGRDLTVTVRL